MEVKITGYYVGQGMAHLIKLTEAGRPTELVLIDFGSSSSHEAEFDSGAKRAIALDAIKAELNAVGGRLERLIFSHMDKDHVNLINKIIAGPREAPKELRSIGKVYIGGTAREIRTFRDFDKITSQSSPALKAAKAIERVCPSTSCEIIQNSETYTNNTDKHLYEYKGTNGIQDTFFRIRVLANRVISKFYKDDIFINSNSVVAVGEFYEGTTLKAAVFFPGDATHRTFVYINNQIHNHKDKYKFLSLDSEKKVLFAPHHGSANTSCMNEVLGGKKKDADIKPRLRDLDRLIDNIKPGYVFASAHYTAHNHPNTEVMNFLSKYVIGTPGMAHKVMTIDLGVSADGKEYEYSTKPQDRVDKNYYSSYYIKETPRLALPAAITQQYGNIDCTIAADGALTCVFEVITA